MNKIDVRVVTLPPLRFICFNGFGPSPEGQAFDKASAWMKANGIWENRKEYRFFGYNNPDPSPGSPNYGYDVWVSVDQTVKPDGEGRLIEFPGGLYAETRVEAGLKGEGIYEAWQNLAAWVEHSSYKPDYRNRQCLEESPDPFNPSSGGFTLHLYEPIHE